MTRHETRGRPKRLAHEGVVEADEFGAEQRSVGINQRVQLSFLIDDVGWGPFLPSRHVEMIADNFV